MTNADFVRNQMERLNNAEARSSRRDLKRASHGKMEGVVPSTPRRQQRAALQPGKCRHNFFFFSAETDRLATKIPNGFVGKLFKAAVALFLFGIMAFVPGCSSDSSIPKETRKEVEEPFYLFRDGAPMAAIVVEPSSLLDDPGERISPVRTGAVVPANVPSDMMRSITEFRRDLREGYNIDLPLGSGSGLPNRVELIVEDRDWRDEDRTTITFPDGQTMRITGGESGVRRAIFRLLEEFAGVRYLFQGSRDYVGIGAHYPPRDTLAIPRRQVEWNSTFPLFRGFNQTNYGTRWDGANNRVYHWGWEVRLGAKSRSVSEHMPDIVFPLQRYADSELKPDEEIFPIHNGERYLAWKYPKQTISWQPRYSYPGTADEAISNILAYLRANPHTSAISLAVNDSGGHCETERRRESETYYRWVNAVAEAVAEEFPNVIFTVLAYREVEPVPDFKLHPNVLALLCFDSHACLDSAVRAKREKLIREWGQVARIGQWGYDTGDHVYKLPRIYFGIQQEMVQFLHENGGEHLFSERSYFTVSEGPKIYLQLKLMENPYLDIEATIRDWCQAAVGSEAALPLYDYYSFWEEYWRTRATETSWWNSRHAQYLSYARYGSYMYGLREGDMAKCRKLMEQMLESARRNGSDDQIVRAGLIMASFEWYEANSVAIAAELVSPGGTLPNREAALKLLQTLPEAQRAAERSFRIPYETKGWIAPGITSRAPAHLPEDTTGAHANITAGSLALVADFLDDKEIQQELKQLSESTQLVTQLRFLCKVLYQVATGDDSDNMLKDGSFESDDPIRWQTAPVHGTIERSSDIGYQSNHSLKCNIEHPNFTTKLELREGEPDTTYFFSARVYLPADQAVAEGRLNIHGSVCYIVDEKLYNFNHTLNIQDVELTPGQWNFVSCTIPAASLRSADRIPEAVALRFTFKRFERGDKAYIDDVRLYPIR